MQIIDSAGRRGDLNAHGVCGGILPGVAPTANAAKPAGQWNQVRFRSLAGRIIVHLNGVKVNEVTLDHPRLAKKPKLEVEIAKLDRKLANRQFLAKAPADVVATQRERREETAATRAKIASALARISGAAAE